MKALVLSGLRLMDKCKKDNIGAYAAQTAFFLIMSLVPLMMFFITLIQYTPISEGMLLNWVNQYLPSYFAPILITILDEVYSKSVGILSTTALVAMWSAAKGVHYLSNGLDEVNNIQEKRNWLLLRIKAVFHTFLFLLAIVVLLVLLVFGHTLEELLIRYIPVAGRVISVILDLRILIVAPVTTFIFMLTYRYLPNHKAIVDRKLNFHNQLPGAFLCVVAIYLFSIGISIYVGYFNGFSMYGSLTTIVLMMFWIYFCMYILLFCAEINEFYYESIEKCWTKLLKK